MMTSNQVATELESIASIAGNIAGKIRNGEEDNTYAAVYWVRKLLTQLVWGLGDGSPSTATIKTVKERYLVAADSTPDTADVSADSDSHLVSALPVE